MRALEIGQLEMTQANQNLIHEELDAILGILLTLSYPLETVRGRRGGVKLADWFHPADTWLNFEQIKLLRKIEPYLPPVDQVVLKSILFQFTPH